jgi:Arc/MetJ family transcription regulator
MKTRKTCVEIDDRLFKAVRKTLGTSTLRETVDGAFREVLKYRARRAEVEALSEGRGLELADEDMMASAWRA